MNNTTSTPDRQSGTFAKAGAAPKPAAKAKVSAMHSKRLPPTLITAAQTDDDQYSGDSNRLLRMAGNLANAAGIESTDALTAQGFAYDIAALVKSALLVPGDICSPERLTLLAETRPVLELLTDCKSVLDLDAVHTASASAAAGADARTYTLEQMIAILGLIAGRARTLQRLLMIVQNGEDDFETAACLDGAYIITTELGAMADACSGSSIVGDRDCWTFGPNFRVAGKAARA